MKDLYQLTGCFFFFFEEFIKSGIFIAVSTESDFCYRRHVMPICSASTFLLTFCFAIEFGFLKVASLSLLHDYLNPEGVDDLAAQ